MSFDPAELALALYEAEGENCFDEPEAGVMLDPPLVAVASADDEWFTRRESTNRVFADASFQFE